jgi:hypothetical protein
MQRREGRVGLDGELIERKVLAGLGECLGELAAPGRNGLARTGIDEVERKARKIFARDRRATARRATRD